MILLYDGFPHLLVSDSVSVGDAKFFRKHLNSSDWILRCSSAVSVQSHMIKECCYDHGAQLSYFVFYSDVLVCPDDF